MKKKGFSLFFILLILIIGFFISNINVTTRQGINYTVYTLKIPLYLKMLDFYDRHFNYKWLVHRIIDGKAAEEEKVMAIFNWTIENIAKQPKELREVDDHVWHIIVRGYGTHDQFSDVFTTLCNYADIDAFFARISNKDKTSNLPLSFVRINGKWRIFDPYNRSYFTKKDNSLAAIQDIAEGNWTTKSLEEGLGSSRTQYADYISEIILINPEKSHKWSRANIQTPINRFFYAIFQKSPEAP